NNAPGRGHGALYNGSASSPSFSGHRSHSMEPIGATEQALLQGRHGIAYRVIDTPVDGGVWRRTCDIPFAEVRQTITGILSFSVVTRAFALLTGGAVRRLARGGVGDLVLLFASLGMV